jgi:hypothetical protein
MKSLRAQMTLAGLIVLLQLTGCEDRGRAGRVSLEPGQSLVSSAAAAPKSPETMAHGRESPVIADLSEPPVLEHERSDASKRDGRASAGGPRAPIQARSVARLPINPRAGRDSADPSRRSIKPAEPSLEPSQSSSVQAEPSLEPESPKIERPQATPNPRPAPVPVPGIMASKPPAPSGPRVSLPVATSFGVGATGLIIGFMGTELYASEPSGGAIAFTLLGAAAAGVGFTMAGVLMFRGDDSHGQPGSEVRAAVGPGSMVLNGTF